MDTKCLSKLNSNMHQHFQGCSHGYEPKEGWALAYLSFLKVSHLGQVLPVGSVASA